MAPEGAALAVGMMELLSRSLRAVIGACFTMAGGLPPLASLALISAAAGVAMLFVFRATSNQSAIRAAKNRVIAHLLELRLFADEPAVMWRAQVALLRANLRYLAATAVPALCIAVPMVILLLHLEAYYGRAPLLPGTPAIVTVHMRSPITDESPHLVAPSGLAVETPPVRVLDRDEVSWRIRPIRAVSGNLDFFVAGNRYEKRLVAGRKFTFVPGRRCDSVLSAFVCPDESRLPAGDVESIDIRYPPAELGLFGITLHWLVWFTVISMLSALLFKRKLKVML